MSLRPYLFCVLGGKLMKPSLTMQQVVQWLTQQYGVDMSSLDTFLRWQNNLLYILGEDIPSMAWVVGKMYAFNERALGTPPSIKQ
jgi:hypothetical protein